jgi:hypothetical protein
LAILIMDMVGVTLIMDMTGAIPIMVMVGAILVMAGVILDTVTQFMVMDITIILIILAEEVLPMQMGFMAIIDILKVLPILTPEEQIILISEEVPQIAQLETILHL